MLRTRGVRDCAPFGSTLASMLALERQREVERCWKSSKNSQCAATLLTWLSVSLSARRSARIVSSLVGDVIMPVIGAVTGGLDFSNYYTALSSKVQAGLSYADAKKQGAVLGWGQFLTITLNFVIVAWVLFLVIKGINKLKKEEPAPPPPGPSPEAKLLTEIRDLLKK